MDFVPSSRYLASRPNGKLVAIAFTDDKGNITHSKSSGSYNDLIFSTFRNPINLPKYGTYDQVAADGKYHFPLLGFETGFSSFRRNPTDTTTWGIHFFDVPLKFSLTVPASMLDLETTKFAKAFILTGYTTELSRHAIPGQWSSARLSNKLKKLLINN
tara:strand:- start:1699 stop:2172 length:474 start_codon:yes stop_codon:yes gene_type:complete